MDPDCIFCKIVRKEAPGDLVYQDELVTAFRDIRPAAPIHLLLVPNVHIASVNETSEQDRHALGHLFLVANRLAEQEGIRESGFRLIVNTGHDGRQEVSHLHMHLLGGHRMLHPLG